MQFESFNRTGGLEEGQVVNITGTIGHIGGFIVALLVTAISFLVMVLIVFFNTHSQDFSEFEPVEATITGIPDESHYNISYRIEDIDYTGVLFSAADYEKGAIVFLYYDPENPNFIVDSQSSSEVPPWLILFAAVFFGGGIKSMKKHRNNFLHYFNPSKYKYDNSENDMSVGTGTISPHENEDIFERRDGNYKGFRF